MGNYCCGDEKTKGQRQIGQSFISDSDNPQQIPTPLQHPGNDCEKGKKSAPTVTASKVPIEPNSSTSKLIVKPNSSDSTQSQLKKKKEKLKYISEIRNNPSDMEEYPQTGSTIKKTSQKNVPLQINIPWDSHIAGSHSDVNLLSPKNLLLEPNIPYDIKRSKIQSVAAQESQKQQQDISWLKYEQLKIHSNIADSPINPSIHEQPHVPAVS